MFFLLPLKKREGYLETPTVAEHTRLDRSRFSRENRKALKFCFGRAKVEHYSIILSQSKRNRSFSHNAWAWKTSTFGHFECVPPKRNRPHFSHQARPRQLPLFLTVTETLRLKGSFPKHLHLGWMKFFVYAKDWFSIIWMACTFHSFFFTGTRTVEKLETKNT